ncbi:hypothetical protein TPHA_0P00260 [Tetrapisispora phaffii CBS 4417]|uniref:Pheromone alpha factor receptor n=1 Tax=Tetrapisispora phaffii (strain ATCC 24235 / CBS 4417 / NBRC 1672 / NRRL Y-8282 / UCD 70-5) TaxID=1071381 RepID=G8C206_TETPH|nr:hypothetical protein TPHA_0P00260 [Tetrapisispora phaffii CBS 4417]CCE66184.1 hypothetical protein TPHA_0P00260 [Tetrapisispora phaffii CBS 4417]
MSQIPELSSYFYDSTYNPGESLVSYTSIYGNDTEVSFNELQSIVNKRVNESIMFGVRCGAACLMFIVMWMISKNKKTPLFIINQCSLVFMIIHSGLYFKYLLSDYASVTYSLTYFPQLINRSDVHLYGAASMFQAFLVGSIELSLVFQIKVLFQSDTYNKRLGQVVLGIGAALGLTTFAMYLVTAIKGMVALYADTSDMEQYFFNVSTILFASSLNFLTCLLVLKLALVVRTRRYLGLRQFDSFHVLLIMAFQTLLIPSILFIIAYSINASNDVDELIIIGGLLVVLSLPLSSMWASSINNSVRPTSLNTSLSPQTTWSSDEKSIYSDQMEPDIKTKITNKVGGFLPFEKTGMVSTPTESTISMQTDIEKASTIDYSK